ncbi:hypothetical protein SDC9_195413 [bioreactor metagenome]|uniref:Uncharacterized protein n=1 Tax=bioreactor metagenome TaxID=1076179 RepID=A0A645IBI1_9ZZZZ
MIAQPFVQEFDHTFGFQCFKEILGCADLFIGQAGKTGSMTHLIEGFLDFIQIPGYGIGSIFV